MNHIRILKKENGSQTIAIENISNDYSSMQCMYCSFQVYKIYIFKELTHWNRAKLILLLYISNLNYYYIKKMHLCFGLITACRIGYSTPILNITCQPCIPPFYGDKCSVVCNCSKTER